MASGYILIDKPIKMSSHGVVNRLRQLTHIKKIGHAGTLDPLATGLMLLAVGREATKKIIQFSQMDKEYLADIQLGEETDTYDREGRVISSYQGEKIKKGELVKALENFLGPQEQLPPMYSAKKVAGQKLYHLARRGKDIERPKQQVVISNLELLSYKWPLIKLRVSCSTGTYIRTLAYDLGRFLGTGAYLAGLRRTKIGPFAIDQAVELDKIGESDWEKRLF